MQYVRVDSACEGICASIGVAKILDAEVIEAISSELEAIADSLTAGELVIDLGSVWFMSSGMIGKLVQLNVKCGRSGIAVRFRNVSRNVLEIFKVTGLHRILRIEVQGEGNSPIRFSPELFEDRNRVIEALDEGGFSWLGDFTAVEPLHDVYGIEVRGIRRGDDANRIQELLEHLYPDWRPG